VEFDVRPKGRTLQLKLALILLAIVEVETSPSLRIAFFARYQKRLAVSGLLALLGGSADGGGLGAFKDGVRGAGAVVKDDQSDGGAHEDDGRPGGEAREHVGGGAGSEGGLRALSTEGAGEVGRAALLDEDNTDQEEAHDQVNYNENIKENLHLILLSKSVRWPDLSCRDVPERRSLVRRRGHLSHVT
jgi:hypothetical protein